MSSNRSSVYSDRHRIKIYFNLIVITRRRFRNNYSAWAFVFDVLITRNPSEFGKTLDLTSRTAIYSCTIIIFTVVKIRIRMIVTRKTRKTFIIRPHSLFEKSTYFLRPISVSKLSTNTDTGSCINTYNDHY